MENTQKKYLNALNIAFSSRPEAVIKISKNFPKAKDAFNICSQELRKLNFQKETILNFQKIKNEIDVEKEWQNLEKEKIRIITKEDNEYPASLKEIAKPPIALYIKGELFSQEKFLASVGTRWPSDYGKMIVPDIVGDLAENGFTIVSGMARGIDSISHKAALERGKRTIAIVGTGLDITFPPENKNLEKEIENNGAIISEFPLGTPPLAYNFPIRNRIIAGISLGTLVSEAKEKSGALITANMAIEEGRDVFAIPGPIFSKTSKGPNNLIKQGARATTEAEDILSEFNLERTIIKEKEIKGENPEESLILKTLFSEPKSINEIIRETKIEVGKLNSSLILMEINGKIKRAGEKYSIKN